MPAATTTAPLFDGTSVHGLARLEHWGVIRAQGADAASFLHGQLTQDFALLDQSEARLAGYCSAKGRMLASFIGWKTGPEEVLLVCNRDLLAPTLKRLSMFVMRAKVKLSDASAEFTLYGAAGAALPAELPVTHWSRLEVASGSWVRLPAAEGVARALLCLPAQQTQSDALPGADLAPALWQWLEVRSGIAMVSAPVIEEFVPQMLNYESVGGVNFKKGCYPGQEVVARSQYRGALKRRAQVFHAEAELVVGQEVFHAADAEQPCGTVAAVAPHPVRGWDAIVSLQTSALDGQALTVGGPDGSALQLLPLPYELLQDI
ncbi:folate-binding protein [Malikia sp.]|uniref:CAF17-like 4Fe-4S cluster assembly/insertion protein YgfZ n=1 Tax=Malikia sp. TaxID=2070706 RepID=UPI002625F225|nr:folate-binding protein [Malikia sp.]MDD2728538.1 folate-binding protein [Malikia sp.]